MVPGPQRGKSAPFEALLEDAKAVTVEVEDFALVAFTVGEQIQMTLEGVMAKAVGDQPPKAVVTFAEVGDTWVGKDFEVGRDDHRAVRSKARARSTVRPSMRQPLGATRQTSGWLVSEAITTGIKASEACETLL